MNEHVKHAADAISAVTVLATLTAWLPPLAALFSIVWSVLRIWEMVTGKKIADRRKRART